MKNYTEADIMEAARIAVYFSNAKKAAKTAQDELKKMMNEAHHFLTPEDIDKLRAAGYVMDKVYSESSEIKAGKYLVNKLNEIA